MFRNLATFILYIAILFYNVYLPPKLILFYTFFMILGDGYEYLPKTIQKKINPLWFYFENHGDIGYNLEFGTILLLSLFIFIKTIFNLFN